MKLEDLNGWTLNHWPNEKTSSRTIASSGVDTFVETGASGNISITNYGDGDSVIVPVAVIVSILRSEGWNVTPKEFLDEQENARKRTFEKSIADVKDALKIIRERPVRHKKLVTEGPRSYFVYDE